MTFGDTFCSQIFWRSKYFLYVPAQKYLAKSIQYLQPIFQYQISNETDLKHVKLIFWEKNTFSHFFHGFDSISPTITAIHMIRVCFCLKRNLYRNVLSTKPFSRDVSRLRYWKSYFDLSLIFSVLPSSVPVPVPVQSSWTEYSLNPDYFYPHPRDSSNETLLDYLGRWNLV